MTGTDRLSSHTNGPTVDYYMSADQLSQSIANNTSVVRFYVRAVCRGSTSTFYSHGDAAVRGGVNGADSGPIGAGADLPAGTPNGSAFWEYGPFDVTVNHNSDGTGSASLGFYVSYPNASSGGGSYSGTLPLSTIPRSTTPGVSSSTVAVGSSVNVTLAPASAGFSHRVWYSFGTLTNKNAGLSGGGGSASGTDGTNGYWGTGTGNQTVALAIPANLAKQMVGLSSAPLTVYVDTYSGGSKIGTTKSVAVSVTPAAGVVYNAPSISAAVFRSLSDGTPDDEGVAATLIVTAAVTSINTGSQQNALTYLWEVSANGVSWQTLATATPGGLTLAGTQYIYTDSNPGTGGTQPFATTSSYEFRLTITDALGSASQQTLSMSTAAAILDVYDEPGELVGVGIGAVYDPVAGGRIQVDGKPVLTYRRNRIINGNFRTNQRAYASGTSLGSGVYGFDRWKTYTASNSLTFTAAPQGQTVTISSADEIGQIIERANMEVGDFVLSWTGTAIGRIYKSGTTPPSYAAGPITYSNDGLADVVVQFQASGGTRTVGLVQVEAGSVPTPFEMLSSAEELLLCMRFYYRIAPAISGARMSTPGWQVTLTGSETAVPLPVPMRTTPSVTINSLHWTDGIGFNAVVSAVGVYTASSTIPGMVYLTVTFASNGAGYRPGALASNGTTGRLELTAEL